MSAKLDETQNLYFLFRFPNKECRGRNTNNKEGHNNSTEKLLSFYQRKKTKFQFCVHILLKVHSDLSLTTPTIFFFKIPPLKISPTFGNLHKPFSFYLILFPLFILEPPFTLGQNYFLFLQEKCIFIPHISFIKHTSYSPYAIISHHQSILTRLCHECPGRVRSTLYLPSLAK